MKKIKIVILTLVILVILFLVIRGIIAVFASQYNSNDISNYPNITIDKGSDKQYICDCSEFKVYTVELSETYFETKDAGTIELYDALTTGKLTIEDMINVCKQQERNDDIKVYTGENYQIIFEGDECLIAPLDYQI